MSTFIRDRLGLRLRLRLSLGLGLGLGLGLDRADLLEYLDLLVAYILRV